MEEHLPEALSLIPSTRKKIISIINPQHECKTQNILKSKLLKSSSMNGNYHSPLFKQNDTVHTSEQVRCA
jgi:hypothetical protein